MWTVHGHRRQALAMPSPGEKLAKLLEERGMKSTFAEEIQRRFKLKTNYNQVYKWTKDRGFNERNQAYAEEILKLERGYFAETPASKRHDPLQFQSLREYVARRSAAGQPVEEKELAYFVRIQGAVSTDPGADFWSTQGLLFKTMVREAVAAKPKRAKS
jgi:hypothetical protein